jgi:hypothetical protein
MPHPAPVALDRPLEVEVEVARELGSAPTAGIDASAGLEVEVEVEVA